MTTPVFDLSSFTLASKVMDGACGPTPSFLILPGKGFCTVTTSNLGSQSFMKLAGEIPGLDGPIEVPRDLFTQTTKGRDSASVTFENDSLLIKQGAYRASVFVGVVDIPPPLVEIPSPLPEGSVHLTLTPGLVQALSSLLPKLKIDKVNPTVRDINVLVKSSTKAVSAVTFDNGTQMCFSSLAGAEDCPKITFCLPYVKFLQLLTSLPLSGTELLITPDAFYIYTKTFQLSVPLGASSNPDDVVDHNAVLDRMSSVKKQEGGSVVTLPKAALLDLMENGKSLVATGTDIRFTPAESKGRKSVVLSITASRGKVQQTVRDVELAEPFGISFTSLQSLLSKVSSTRKPKKGDEPDDAVVSEDVTFSVFDGAFVVGNSGPLFYVTTLSAMEDTDGK